jgi:2-keto-4-pentenoate hydratase/2-oxohepta-3-ene-1,7-dioic acid hydratase in catechol pathway
MNDLAVKKGKRELRFEMLDALPVVERPNMLCAGSNYCAHVAEMMTHNAFNQDQREPGESDESFYARNLAIVEKRKTEGMPFVWTGLHSSLCGANDDIALPLIGQHPDWELEFGVLTKNTGRYMSPEQTDDVIAAYVMCNDIGTVDEFRRSDVRFMFDWMSKHQPTFKTLGPFAVPKEFVDRSKVNIKLKLNGATMQDWPITDMIFTPEQILSYLSERIRLTPGDLLITGSPPGNGAFHGNRWMRPGDIIESEITYLGRQRNNVVAEEAEGKTLTYGPFV